MTRGGSLVVQSLPTAVAELAGLAEAGALGGRREAAVSLAAARAAERAVAELHAELLLRTTPTRHTPAASYALARRYVLGYAAAACLRFWLENREHPGSADGLRQDGCWLRACLVGLLQELAPARPDTADDTDDLDDLDDETFDPLLEQLLAQYDRGELFSPLTTRLAEAQA